MMKFPAVAVLVCLFGVATAHFRLLSPEPRGAFVADQEPNFCGGYTDVTTNRTTFPLSGGFFSVKTGHPGWTAGVLISTVQNPTSFDNFSVNGQPQLVRNYAKEATAGTYCIPLNISAANIPGVEDGSNVTIQVVFEGGDGNLYQCADLTLSSALATPNATCENVTATSTSSHSPAATSTQPATGASLGLKHELSAYVAGLFALGGIVAALV